MQLSPIPTGNRIAWADVDLDDECTELPFREKPASSTIQPKSSHWPLTMITWCTGGSPDTNSTCDGSSSLHDGLSDGPDRCRHDGLSDMNTESDDLGIIAWKDHGAHGAHDGHDDGGHEGHDHGDHDDHEHGDHGDDDDHAAHGDHEDHEDLDHEHDDVDDHEHGEDGELHEEEMEAHADEMEVEVGQGLAHRDRFRPKETKQTDVKAEGPAKEGMDSVVSKVVKSVAVASIMVSAASRLVEERTQELGLAPWGALAAACVSPPPRGHRPPHPQERKEHVPAPIRHAGFAF